MKSTPVTPESLVVGFDGSSGSEQALDWAVAEARRTARPLHLVRAVGRHDPKAFDPGAEVDAATSLAVEQVMAKAPELRVGAQSREGSAAAVLVEASRTAATVVVGARGHRQAQLGPGRFGASAGRRACQLPGRGRQAREPGARHRGGPGRRRSRRQRTLRRGAELRLRAGLLTRAGVDGGPLLVVGAAGRLPGRQHQ